MIGPKNIDKMMILMTLLGICVSSDLKWADHVDAIVSSAASRVHFLKQLKRAGVPVRDLLHFYTATVRRS